MGPLEKISPRANLCCPQDGSKLSVYLSICLSDYLCIYLSIFIWSIRIFVPSICVCVYLCTYPSVSLSVCLSVCLFVCLSVWSQEYCRKADTLAVVYQAVVNAALRHTSSSASFATSRTLHSTSANSPCRHPCQGELVIKRPESFRNVIFEAFPANTCLCLVLRGCGAHQLDKRTLGRIQS